MKKNSIVRLSIALTVIVLLIVSVFMVLAVSSSADDRNVFGGEKTQTFEKTETVDKLLACSNHYIVVKHKQLGGTHYAYTAALAETNTAADIYKEYNFDAGSSLCVLSVLDNGNGTVSTYEKELLECRTGVIRDPSVSLDGTKVLFSMKENTYDDFHIYEMDLTSDKYAVKQLTFGSGRSDIEPQYLANGNIVFSSNRSVQTVDCWITPVSNMYIMDGNGENIRRVGYDQVHTTYPTVASDGRVLYTRWDYNDRTQMFVQSLFQMFQDGTYQTEVWGNNFNFPTTLLHTRDIPGAPGKYVSIASGHHVNQMGKLCVIDTNEGRNEKEAVQFLFPDSTTSYSQNVDAYGQNGRVYKYPYAIDETTFLVSSAASSSGKNTPFSIYLCDSSKKWANSIELVKGTNSAPASQIVPIKSNAVFNRPSSVDYSTNTGTYYIANVYEGEAVKGVETGSAKYLRVVEIVYRSSAIGATYASGGTAGGTGDPFSPIATGNGSWDVKAVLGIVPIEEDGSVLFSVPSDTPVYFQLLDKDGCVIQTMRSWSTLMPGETFSCVGCHENKNTAPVSGAAVTMAMKKGVVKLQKDLWMKDFDEYDSFDPYKDESIGFSYVDMIQSIFDESCVKCHSNTETSLTKIKAESASAESSVEALGYIIPKAAKWQYSISNGKSNDDYAPFGKPSQTQTDINTKWTSGTLTLKNDFLFTQYNKEACVTQLELAYSGSILVKLNGEEVFSDNSAARTDKTVKLTDAQKSKLVIGKNTIEITVSGGTCYFDGALRSYVPSSALTIIEKASQWKYQMSATNSVGSDWYRTDFNDSSWLTGRAPFGDRGDVSKVNTPWNGSQNYIWVRQSFELTAEQLTAMTDGTITFNIFYDDTMKMYINGTLVMNKSGWNDAYENISITNKPQTLFKEGTNVIAISLCNSAGGRQIDLSMSCSTRLVTAESTAPFSLAGGTISPDSNRMLRDFPLSYLFLTSSTPSSRSNQTSGINWVGNANGTYIKWISTMSGAEMVDPYYAGSYKSALYAKVRGGHGNLTDSQIRAIACWIDLAVPCFGTYDENEDFNENAMRMFVERENKRNFYEQWDRYVKMGLGGILPAGKLEVSYVSSSGNVKAAGSGDGYVILNISDGFRTGDRITVKVTGSKYVAISLNERQGESLLYLPDGEYVYTVPASMGNIYNVTMRSSGNAAYTNNTVFVRIPTEDELKAEHNLALNPYDLSDNGGVYPHASSDSVKDGLLQFEAKTAIDGFVSTGTASSWPYQSWTPESADGSIKIDFGREVVVNTLQILLRGALADTHLISAVVTFSDGSTQEISLWNTDHFMAFDLGGKTVKSLTLSGFEKASSKDFAITEIRVLGTEK